MSLFDSQETPLAVVFNKPSQLQEERILARRLCKTLGIDYASLDKKAKGSALVEQVVDRYLKLHPDSLNAVKRLLPSTKMLAQEIQHEKPKTAHRFAIALRSCAY